MNRSTLTNKSALHYLILLLVILIPLFIVYVLVLCIRTRNVRRKWLWVLFILPGVGQFGINWTTGTLQVKPVAVQLFGAAASAAFYGPWVVSVSLPLGAILFLLRRKKYASSASTEQIQGV